MIRFAITGESFYYRFVNGIPKEADLGYPNVDPKITSVFDDRYPSHLILVVKKECANKPASPELRWTGEAIPHTLTTNVGEINAMVDAATSIMGTNGYSERGSNIFYISLNNNFLTIANGDIPAELRTIVNYQEEDKSIHCGLNNFLKAIISHYTKARENMEFDPIPIKQLGSTNQCTQNTTTKKEKKKKKKKPRNPRRGFAKKEASGGKIIKF